MDARPWFAHYENGIPRTLDVPDLTLPQVLQRTAAAWG